MHENPLGKSLDHPQDYAPGALFPIARSASRDALPVNGPLAFHGEDLWNAWELGWLDPSGKPMIATAVIRIPAQSENLIESKSLKLYLNSLANTRYSSDREVATLIASDLTTAAGCTVTVKISAATSGDIDQLPGTCIDDSLFEAAANDGEIPALQSDAGSIASEELHSHLLRSNCPVTGQPDTGSILIRYEGPKIDRSRLLQYIVSYRNYNAFHEDCVERIFVDIRNQCATKKLTVYARYNRRGGLDINPFRSDYEQAPQNLRLWRQ
jgi:7-cyano-7-deazaguanine reductase